MSDAYDNVITGGAWPSWLPTPYQPGGSVPVLSGCKAYWPLDDPVGGTVAGGSNWIREASGAWLSDRNLWFPVTGLTPATLGLSSIMPGVTATCLQKTGTSSVELTWPSSGAQRAAAIPTGALTVVGWFQPTTLNGGGNDGNSKLYGQWFGFNIGLDYQSLVVGGLSAPGARFFVPNATFMLAVTFDGTHARTSVNGVPQGSVASSAPLQVSANLEIGGLFNSLAILGFLQKFAVAQVAWSDAQLQGLYMIGARSLAETAGENLNVYPFSRQAVATNPSRTMIALTNTSDTPMYISLGDTTKPAAPQAGPPIPPNAIRPWSSATYKGPIQICHSAPLGAKLLVVEEH
jgi:hypothetical protein